MMYADMTKVIASHAKRLYITGKIYQATFTTFTDVALDRIQINFSLRILLELQQAHGLQRISGQ